MTKEQKEFSKRLIIEEIKQFCDLHRKNEGIGEQGLDELADIILNFSKYYISKDKIRKIINKYIDIDEHLKYTNQELYGDDLKNMINELLEEK